MVKVAKSRSRRSVSDGRSVCAITAASLNLGKKFKKLQTVVFFRDKNKTQGKKPSTFKRLYTYFAILTAIFLVCAVIFTVIIATQWNAMLSDLPAGYVEVGVLLILDAVPAVQGIVWLVRL